MSTFHTKLLLNNMAFKSSHALSLLGKSLTHTALRLPWVDWTLYADTSHLPSKAVSKITSSECEFIMEETFLTELVTILFTWTTHWQKRKRNGHSSHRVIKDLGYNFQMFRGQTNVGLRDEVCLAASHAKGSRRHD